MNDAERRRNRISLPSGPGHGRLRLSRRSFLGALGAGAVCLGLDGDAIPAGRENAKTELAFGVAADAQYGDVKPWAGRQYRESARKLAECVKDLNTKRLDFTIHLGDLIERGFGSFRTMCSIFDRLTMPHYHVLGNHDFSVKEGEKAKVLGVLGLDKLGTKRGCYDFTVGRWRFVVLNATDVSTYANPPGSEKHRQATAMMQSLRQRGARNAARYNGALGRKQLAWLAGRLAAAGKARRRAIVCCHMPAYPPDSHNLYDDADALKVIDGHSNVVAWISGHNHAGNYAVRKGVHHLTLKGMVETHENAFAVVEVHANCLKVVGCGREPKRTLGI